MPKQRLYSERELANLAKESRIKSGFSKAELARKLKVARPSLQQAEENPEQSLTKLRIRIIEACSPYRVCGPSFWLKGKQ